MTENQLPITKTSRHFTHGNPTEKTKHVWIVLHGYGQLANYFLRWFESLDPETHFVVAPEGLHRFYLDGFSGRVGASWMTKEDRLTDIEDYCNYLDDVYKHVLQGFDSDKVVVNVLGFSQGAATVSRWICKGNAKPDNFILWAGVFPPDVQFEVNKPIFDGMKLFVVVGDDDEFITSERVEKERSLLDEQNVDYTFLEFEGKHKVDSAALAKLAANL